MGPPRGGAPDTQGRSSHSLGLQTYCPPPTMLSRYLDLRKGVGATNHHHPTPQGCLLPPALGPEPQAPDTDTPWRTDPHGLDTPVCRLRAPGSRAAGGQRQAPPAPTSSQEEQQTTLSPLRGWALGHRGTCRLLT